jgi:hypothetical protein
MATGGGDDDVWKLVRRLLTMSLDNDDSAPVLGTYGDYLAKVNPAVETELALPGMTTTLAETMASLTPRAATTEATDWNLKAPLARFPRGSHHDMPPGAHQPYPPHHHPEMHPHPPPPRHHRRPPPPPHHQHEHEEEQEHWHSNAAALGCEDKTDEAEVIASGATGLANHKKDRYRHDADDDLYTYMAEDASALGDDVYVMSETPEDMAEKIEETEGGAEVMARRLGLMTRQEFQARLDARDGDDLKPIADKHSAVFGYEARRRKDRQHHQHHQGMSDAARVMVGHLTGEDGGLSSQGQAVLDMALTEDGELRAAFEEAVASGAAATLSENVIDKIAGKISKWYQKRKAKKEAKKAEKAAQQGMSAAAVSFDAYEDSSFHDVNLETEDLNGIRSKIRNAWMKTFGGADKGQTLRATTSSSDPAIVRELVAVFNDPSQWSALDNLKVANDDKQDQKVSFNMRSRIGGSGGQRGRSGKSVATDSKVDYNAYNYKGHLLRRLAIPANLQIEREWFLDMTAGRGMAVGALVDLDLGVHAGGMHTVQVGGSFDIASLSSNAALTSPVWFTKSKDGTKTLFFVFDKNESNVLRQRLELIFVLSNTATLGAAPAGATTTSALASVLRKLAAASESALPVLYAHAKKQAVAADSAADRAALAKASESLARFFASKVAPARTAEDVRRNLGVQVPDVKPQAATQAELALAVELHRALTGGGVSPDALAKSLAADLANGASRGRLARTVCQVLHATGQRLHGSYLDAADHVKVLWEQPALGLANFVDS